MSSMTSSALVVVDMQYDFIDGSLACENAEEAVARTVSFIESFDGPVLFTRDYHPGNHSSFTDNGGTWPSHCVAGTHGAEIHSALQPFVSEELCFDKGCDVAVEQYSGFEGVNQAGQSLAEVLQLLDVQEVCVCGIATEFCVRNTFSDLKNAGFNVRLLIDCLAWVAREGHEKTLEELGY